ncbi:MAG TPA: hypothetical protein VMW39_06855 [bacterium]|nr:hypothetical protein [bacterium]
MCKMPDKLATHTVSNYKCSGCWGALVKAWVKDTDGQLLRTEEGEILCEVVCRRDQIDLGFVSKTFIEKASTKDFENAYEVKRDLVNFGIIKKEVVDA